MLTAIWLAAAQSPTSLTLTPPPTVTLPIRAKTSPILTMQTMQTKSTHMSLLMLILPMPAKMMLAKLMQTLPKQAKSTFSVALAC